MKILWMLFAVQIFIVSLASILSFIAIDDLFSEENPYISEKGYHVFSEKGLVFISDDNELHYKTNKDDFVGEQAISLLAKSFDLTSSTPPEIEFVVTSDMKHFNVMYHNTNIGMLIQHDSNFYFYSTKTKKWYSGEDALQFMVVTWLKMHFNKTGL